MFRSTLTRAVRPAALRTVVVPAAGGQQSRRQAHAISNPTLVDIEKRWEGMPPQEQAELWMALRDRMKVNWAELTLQEKKAAYYIAFGAHGPRAVAPPGEGWKVAGYTVLGIGVSFAIFVALRLFAGPSPGTMNKEYQEATNEYLRAQLRFMLEVARGEGSKSMRMLWDSNFPYYPNGPGSLDVKVGDYELLKSKDSKEPLSPSVRLLPGTYITMTILVSKSELTGHTCPIPLCRSNRSTTVPGGGRLCCESHVWFDKSSKKRRSLQDLLDVIDQRDTGSRLGKRKLDQDSAPRKRVKNSSTEDSFNSFKNVRWTMDSVTSENISESSGLLAGDGFINLESERSAYNNLDGAPTALVHCVENGPIPEDAVLWETLEVVQGLRYRYDTIANKSKPKNYSSAQRSTDINPHPS
ncbi:hypothetical protein G7Y89_g13126 [Cudoniella acicularis]|uniref:Cytochrome c oxidase polypeptide V n=1 Tax=Cudoniella acicularis TaxID=354080 RepID=A0A8H4RA53_9HELO|nr:hypothetical protein G7Y89_g13126 [Cudoniella acicularis]